MPKKANVKGGNINLKGSGLYLSTSNIQRHYNLISAPRLLMDFRLARLAAGLSRSVNTPVFQPPSEF
eukprot:scaffold146112_cov18-Prasinocladus_malaysianus.AAC.2